MRRRKGVHFIKSKRLALKNHGRVCRVLAPSKAAEDPADDEWTVATRIDMDLGPDQPNEWAIRILEGAEDVSLGISHGPITLDGDICENDARRYDVFGRTCELVGPVDAVRKGHFEGSFSDGDVIRFRYDPVQRALYFGINHLWMVEPIFTDLASDVVWYPYCAFAWHDVVLEIEEPQEPM